MEALVLRKLRSFHTWKNLSTSEMSWELLCKWWFIAARNRYRHTLCQYRIKFKNHILASSSSTKHFIHSKHLFTCKNYFSKLFKNIFSYLYYWGCSSTSSKEKAELFAKLSSIYSTHTLSNSKFFYPPATYLQPLGYSDILTSTEPVSLFPLGIFPCYIFGRLIDSNNTIFRDLHFLRL